MTGQLWKRRRPMRGSSFNLDCEEHMEKSLAAESATQGERPAEARALAELVLAYFGHTRPDDYMNCDQQIYDMAQALLSPQEGATAVGADELLADYEKIGAVPWSHATDRLWSWAERARARVAGLEGSDADQLRVMYEARSHEWERALQRAEAAESSLRTLGDALERAREALDRIAKSRLNDFSTLHPDGCASEAQDALNQIDALIPPTRDTSCEAVAKQEPPAKWDVRKSPCPTCGHHIRTVERVPFQYEDDADTPSSPSDKGADE